MLPAALVTLLQEKIQAHLEESGGKLEKLAEELSVRPTSLRGLLAGNPRAGCSWSEAFLISRFFMPDQVIPIFTQYAPDYIDEFARFEDLSQNHSQKSDLNKPSQSVNIASKVFQSVYHYRVYIWILINISREDIGKKFGARGLAILDEFIAADIVWMDTDGVIRPSTQHTFVLSTSDLKRQAELNIKLLGPSSNENWIWTRLATLTPDGAKEMNQVMLDARKKIWDVMADKVNDGTCPVHVTLIYGRDLEPESGSTFEDRVNNYRQAYDLDESTASKVAMIAHDMRGPLGYLTDYMEKMAAKHQMDADYHLAKSAMNRVNSMVQCFKDLNSSSIIVRQKEMMFLDECRDLAESYAIQFKKSFEYTGSLQFLGDLDAEKVDRALQNLITNAFEAASTQVRIEVSRRDSDFIMRVSDDGSGVPENQVEKLFQKGFTHGKENGTGLGLAFVKHVADGHGGVVTYERSSDGWTLFTMIIPHVFFEELLDEDAADPIEKSDSVHSEELLLFRPKHSQNIEVRQRMVEVVSAKPLLLVLLDFPYVTSEKIEYLRKNLPDYHVSTSYDDVERAWLICFDSEDSYRDFIVERKLNAIWMPEESSLSSPRLLETIQGMATHELKKFKKFREEFKDRHDL